MSKISIKFDLILANLPYVSQDWNIAKESPGISYEPKTALFAAEKGLRLIKELLMQVAKQKNLAESGHVLLEADPCQHKEIVGFSKNFGFKHVKTVDYVIVLK